MYALSMHFRHGDSWQLLIDVSTHHIGPISKPEPWRQERYTVLNVGNQLSTKAEQHLGKEKASSMYAVRLFLK
jgi:hypothetical protein